jgi:predicted N-acetyltransferase YhbS
MPYQWTTEVHSVELHVIADRHLKGLSALHNEVFNSRVSPLYFVEKYGMSSKDTKKYSIVAEDDGRVIGFLGLVPQTFVRGTSLVRVLIAADFSLSRGYRGKKIFDQLHSLGVQIARKDGVEAIYGFQSDQTYKVCLRWCWQDLTLFSRFHVPVFQAPIPIVKVLRKLGFRKLHDRWCWKIMSWKLAKHNTLTSSISEFKYSRHYEKTYLRSMSFSNKKHIQFEDGSLAVIRMDSKLTVGFLRFGKDPNVILSKLKSLARLALIDEIIIHEQVGSPTHQILDSIFLAQPSYKVSFISLNGDNFCPDGVALHYIDIDNF